jgi:amino acid transporter
MCFCIGDVNEVLSAPSPFVQVFLNSTGSKAGTVILLVPIILAFMSALISEIATASRQLWSFARDGGLPGGHYLEPVPDAETPRRAVWATIFLAFCIACINFGPLVGFNAIISLVICSLSFSYTITIACTIYRRFFGAPLPKERFNLGTWGGPINIIALCCCAPVTVISLFPSVPNPTPAYMNWACVVFGFVVIVAAVNYAISGRTVFNPPMRKLDY